MPKVFTDDDEFEGVDDYAEEFTDKNGNHVRKEVHKGAGWSSVSIESSDHRGFSFSCQQKCQQTYTVGLNS